ncbi:MAG: hypothetical protein GY797_17720 [Deltaproteobacteria bacterium]|nr:hypothetical protein [Deltaproteobacteria bacterium]
MGKPIDTVGELIERLKKLPKDHKLQVDVDGAYTSYIYNVYIDQYEKNQGRDYVTIKV